jgi:hypothetical protein
MSFPLCGSCGRKIKAMHTRWGIAKENQLISCDQAVPLVLSTEDQRVRICDKCYYQNKVCIPFVPLLKKFIANFHSIFYFLLLYFC